MTCGTRSRTIPAVFPLVLWASLWLVAGAAPAAAESPTYRFEEPAEDGRVYSVDYRLNVSGQLEERTPQNESTKHPLTSDAQLRFAERRLPPAGQRAAALRVLRYFDEHRTNVKVADQKTELVLPRNRRLFVVHGQEYDLQYYAPERLLTARELDQLRMPFDPLAVLGLLPPTEVKVGGDWTADTWVLQLLTGTEAVLKGEVKCVLQSVEDDLATVTLTGSVDGGRYGASTKISFEGRYRFHVTQNYLAELDVTQTEKSSISPVSPGLDVKATIHFERRPVDAHPEITDAAVADIPLDPDPIRMLLSFDSPWSTRFLHERNWHVIPGRYVVLRLMQNGSLITQGTMMGLPQAAAGEHVPEQQFQQDIRQSLGDKLQQIASAEQIPTNDGRFLYRVTALGNINGQEMHWIYYLCAAPDGRQVSFVFATEAKLLETLAERDIALIRTLTWPQTQPSKAN